jgi:hypothetical protein
MLCTRDEDLPEPIRNARSRINEATRSGAAPDQGDIAMFLQHAMNGNPAIFKQQPPKTSRTTSGGHPVPPRGKQGTSSDSAGASSASDVAGSVENELPGTTDIGMERVEIEYYEEDESALNKLVLPDRFTAEYLLHVRLMQRQPQLAPHLYPLLCGVPGTGKTSFVQALARRVGAATIFVSASQILSQFFSVAHKMWRLVFTTARAVPSDRIVFVFIDELDCLSPSRTVTTEDRTGFQTFVQQLDATKLHKNVMVWGATNIPDAIDKALARRFTKTDMPVVTVEHRKGLFLNNNPGMQESDAQALAEQCADFTMAEIQKLNDTADSISLCKAMKSTFLCNADGVYEVSPEGTITWENIPIGKQRRCLPTAEEWEAAFGRIQRDRELGSMNFLTR